MIWLMREPTTGTSQNRNCSNGKCTTAFWSRQMWKTKQSGWTSEEIMVSVVIFLHLVGFWHVFKGVNVVLNGTLLKQSVSISDNIQNQSICWLWLNQLWDRFGIDAPWFQGFSHNRSCYNYNWAAKLNKSVIIFINNWWVFYSSNSVYLVYL